MAKFKFQFPKDASLRTGKALDDATVAFNTFSFGVQRLPEGHWPAHLEKLREKDFNNFLQFAQGLLEKKSTHRRRVELIVKRWSRMSPGFKEALERHPLGQVDGAASPARSRRGSASPAQAREEEDPVAVAAETPSPPPPAAEMPPSGVATSEAAPADLGGDLGRLHRFGLRAKCTQQ